MYQDLFTIPGTHITIHGYGLMLVIGFLLGTQLATFLARRARLDPEVFTNIALIALLTGVSGARLSHVLENLGDYTRHDLSFAQNLKNMVDVSSGGLTYYGGFLLAVPSCLLYGWYKKVPLKVGMDIIAPCAMIGLALGRVGCFMNGCCYGAECNLPWAVQFPYGSDAYDTEARHGILKQPVPPELQREPLVDPLPVPKQDAKRRGVPDARLAELHSNRLHPAQLYSTITALMIAGICVCYFTLRHVDGRVFALMCMLEGPTRFILEMLRVEPTQVGSLTLSEFIGIIVFASGVLLWFAFGWKRTESQGGQPLTSAALGAV